MQVRLLPKPLLFGRTAIGAVSRLENGRALRPLGVRLPLLPFIPAWSRRNDARLLLARGRFEPCRRSSRPSCPRGRTGDDAGPSTRKLRVRAPPGVLCTTTGCRGVGHPTGFGRRRSQVRLLPARLRGRGEAVLASLMSSRPWVRIPPALSTGSAGRRAGRGSDGTRAVQSAGPNVRLAS